MNFCNSLLYSTNHSFSSIRNTYARYKTRLGHLVFGQAIAASTQWSGAQWSKAESAVLISILRSIGSVLIRMAPKKLAMRDRLKPSEYFFEASLQR